MRQFFLLTVFAAMLLAAPLGSSRAGIILSFDPVAQHTANGLQVDVDIRVSGLGTNAAPSLGAFDLTVNFDDLVLDFTGLTFGNQLDLFGFDFNPRGFAEDPDSAVGAVSIFEVSLDTVGDLNALQADSFVLATLTFSAMNMGFSFLDFSSVILSDSLGNALGATLSSGGIAVPEPSTLILFGLGILALAAAQWVLGVGGQLGSPRRRA